MIYDELSVVVRPSEKLVDSPDLSDALADHDHDVIQDGPSSYNRPDLAIETPIMKKKKSSVLQHRTDASAALPLPSVAHCHWLLLM